MKRARHSRSSPFPTKQRRTQNIAVPPPPAPDTYLHWLPPELYWLIDKHVGNVSHSWNLFLAWNLGAAEIVATRLGWSKDPALSTQNDIIRRLLGSYCKLCGRFSRQIRYIPRALDFNKVCYGCSNPALRSPTAIFHYITRQLRIDVKQADINNRRLCLRMILHEVTEEAPRIRWYGIEEANLLQILERFSKRVNTHKDIMECIETIKQHDYYREVSDYFHTYCRY
jgi:hypothetical protein